MLDIIKKNVFLKNIKMIISKLSLSEIVPVRTAFIRMFKRVNDSSFFDVKVISSSKCIRIIIILLMTACFVGIIVLVFRVRPAISRSLVATSS